MERKTDTQTDIRKDRQVERKTHTKIDILKKGRQTERWKRRKKNTYKHKEETYINKQIQKDSGIWTERWIKTDSWLN